MQIVSEITVSNPSAVFSRDALTASIAILANVIERTAIPILENVRITGKGKSVELRATDLDREIVVTIPGAADIRLDATIPLKSLQKLLKGAPKADYVAIEDIDGHCKVEFEKVNYRLQSLPAVDYPTMEWNPASPARICLSSDLFQSGLAAVQGAISTEETRYYLNGVYFHAMQGELTMVATDGHRLYRQRMGDAGAFADIQGGIIPAGTVKALLNILKGKKCGSAVDVAMSQTKIQITLDFEFGELVMTSKLIDGTFPDYQRVIPSGTWGDLKPAQFHRGELIESIKACSLISSEKGRAIKLTIASDGGALDINNPAMGSAHADLPVMWDHDAMEIGFNAQYMLALLAQVEGDEVTLQLRDSGSPCRIDSGSWTGVVMPMRV